MKNTKKPYFKGFFACISIEKAINTDKMRLVPKVLKKEAGHGRKEGYYKEDTCGRYRR